jgi:predicted amidohydrolase YtcJ
MTRRALKVSTVAIVAARLLAGASAPISAQRATPFAVAEHPDLILHSGKVFTAAPTDPWAPAVAIRGDRIVAVGSNAIRASAGPETRSIDLKGRVVIPGINDTHVHLGYSAPVGGTLPSDPANWREGPEPQHILDGLAALARGTPPGTWLRADMGLRIRRSSLRRSALDKIAPDHPVLLKATYGHGSLVNSRALRLIGVSDSTPDPVGGWYEREPGTRVMTGLLDGSAQYDAWNAYFSSAPEVMAAELRRNAAEALRYGITTLQHMPILLGAAESERAFRNAALPLRIRLIQAPYPGRLSDWTRIKNRAISPLTYVSGIKYLVDGTSLEQWALMTEAYGGRPGWYGRLYYSADTVRRFLSEALTGRDQLMVHVIGDATAALVLRLMNELAPDSTWRDKRVRFEHANGIAGPNIEQARRFGIVASQPRVDAAQIAAWKTAGIPVAHGSDGEPGNPWVHVMRSTSVETAGSALSREDAVRMMTVGSAYAEFKEHEKGRLQPGMLADLAVLSQDVFTVEADALPASRSIMTIVGGKAVYDAGVLDPAPAKYPNGAPLIKPSFSHANR